MTAAHLGSFRALPERVIVTVHDPDQHPEAWDTYLSGVHDCYDGFGAAHLVRRDVVLAQPCRMFWLIRSEHGEVIGGARAVGPVWRAEDIEQIPAVQELGSSPSAPEIRSQLADLADRGLVEAKGGWSAPGVRGLGPLLGRFLWHCSWWFGAGTTVATSGVEANIDRWRTAGCEPLPGIEPAPDVPVPGHHTIPLVLAADRLSTAPPPEVRRQLVAEWGYLHPARNRAAGLETTGLEVTPEVDPTRWEYRTTAPVDRTPDLRREYREATFGQEATPGPWVRLPWRGETVRVLEPTDFHRLRTDRNRHKLTDDDLATLRTKRVGVVGLSVGHAIAYTLAQEGLCGQLRLADPDHLELSNLNRLPASITDLGRSKTAIIGRRIAEIDPFLDVRLYDEGVLAESLDRFLDGLDLVIEECDSLDVKLALRTAAAARGIPVVMETNDRGMLDVERFDLEPGRPPFHGLLGELDPAELGGLSQSDKVPAVLGIVEADKLSAVMAASMVEIDQSIASWPQLAADVHLGAALVATAARNILLGRWSRSGRVRIDLDRLDADLVEPAPDPPGRTPPPIIHRRAELPARFEEAITVA
ncbi:MAG: ThiF family adenylyltransferase, partial [Actinomycetota bacterium]